MLEVFDGTGFEVVVDSVKLVTVVDSVELVTVVDSVELGDGAAVVMVVREGGGVVLISELEVELAEVGVPDDVGDDVGGGEPGVDNLFST